MAASGVGAALLVLIFFAPGAVHRTIGLMHTLLADLGTSPQRALETAVAALLMSAGPFILAAMLAGSASTLLQTGFLLKSSALAPDLGRLDPRRGVKKSFGLDNSIEAFKALLKLGLIGWAMWGALAGMLPLLSSSVLLNTDSLADRIGQAVVQLTLLAFGAQVAIALLDTGYTRWRFNQRLRMSREEVKQESRDSDGDPHVKGRLKQLRSARSRRRMLAAVSRATVVITNPTHYAVALAYQRGGAAAPRIVAKGVDEIAARIRHAAEMAGVPLVANPPLARALYTAPLDSEVASEHFRVVAEIIAYVWRLQGAARR